MKKIILLGLMVFTYQLSIAQSKTDTIYAKGNCGHCKERIESNVMKINGVKEANWNPELAQLICVYDEQVTNNAAIQKMMASVGHDTDLFRADDKVYKELPGCCKYERDVVFDKNSKIQVVEFMIEGMTCAEGCAKGIELSILKQKGIKSSSVNFQTHRAKVVFDSSKISKEKIMELAENFVPEGEAPHYRVKFIK